MDKDLLYRFFEGRASVEEMRLVKEWSEASEENSKLLRRERKLFNAIILSGRFESSDGQTTLRKKRNHFVREFLKIASVVAITVGITAALFSIGEDKEDMNVAMQTITVPAGQRVNLDLPDGSNVWLNAGTTMKYPVSFMKGKREVILDGEAYFEVAKNKEIPFYVNTETNQVRVVGTHFNVCAYKGSNEFETTLVEGIVDIYAYDNERPLTRLTKNEFFGSYQGKYKKAVLPSYDYLRWREGLYCFDDSPFSCILTKLEKYYNVKITVENPKVLNYRCTGKFKEQDGVEHILKVIQKDHPFTYSISEEGDSIRIE